MVPALGQRQAGDQVAEAQAVHDGARMERSVGLVAGVRDQRVQARAEDVVEVPRQHVDRFLLRGGEMRHPIIISGRYNQRLP